MGVDLIVAGAGPAGLATSICAARRGLRVCVLEKRQQPLDKPCGEGLMPAGVAALEEMGVQVPAWGRAAFRGIRYVDGEVVAQGEFPHGSGLGVRRTALSQGLALRARELGVELRFGVEVRSARWQGGGTPGAAGAAPSAGVSVDTNEGVLAAGALVAADGLQSRLRAAAGLAGAPGPRRRFGMRRHYRMAPWCDFVEVHWAPGAEAYVTPAGPELVGVALLWGGDGRHFDALLQSFPALARRVAGAPPASGLHGAGPFEQRVQRRFQGRLALVGDAAGYLDPLTGEGLSLGFRSAAALADILARGAPLADYERAWRRLSRACFQMTRLLLEIAARPRLRRRVVAMLAREPEVFARMLAISGGEAPLASLGPGGLARLLRGLALAAPEALGHPLAHPDADLPPHPRARSADLRPGPS